MKWNRKISFSRKYRKKEPTLGVCGYENIIFISMSLYQSVSTPHSTIVPDCLLKKKKRGIPNGTTATKKCGHQVPLLRENNSTSTPLRRMQYIPSDGNLPTETQYVPAVENWSFLSSASLRAGVARGCYGIIPLFCSTHNEGSLHYIYKTQNSRRLPRSPVGPPPPH